MSLCKRHVTSYFLNYIRGYGRCLVYRNSKTQTKQLTSSTGKTIEMINGPRIDAETGKKDIKDECLDFDGIAAPGVRVKAGRKLINKVAITQRVGQTTLPEEVPCPMSAPPGLVHFWYVKPQTN